MQLRLEKCSSNHLDELVEISRSTFVTAFAHDNDPDDFKVYMDSAFSRETIERQLNTPDSYFYFVYFDSDLAGYFKLNKGPVQTDLKDLNSIEIERIYVLSNFQGKKIGQWILDQIKEIARWEKLRYIWLGVWEKNVKAIDFYARYGYEKFDEHPYFIGKDRQIDWLMRYDMTNLAPQNSK